MDLGLLSFPLGGNLDLENTKLLPKVLKIHSSQWLSEPRPGLISPPKSKLGIKFKAFGWTEL